MKDRLLKNYATTILGIIAIAGAIYMHVSKDYTSQEAIELGALGLIFLRSRDSLIGLDK